MATYDTNRAAFVQQDSRYAVKSDATVLARNPSARMVEVSTYLDEASATALAAAYLADNVSPRAFELELEGVTYLDALVAGVPAFVLNLPSFQTDGRTYKAGSFTTDFEKGTTTFQVRG